MFGQFVLGRISLFTAFSIFLPSKVNRDLWQIREEVDSLILKVVRSRQEENRSSLKPEKDLLQTILETADVDDAMNEKACFSFVVDPCKNIYFSGQEMTATTISWSMMQLALHPEWQDCIRAEIAEFCGDQLCHRGSLDFKTLRKLKVVSCMIWLLDLITGLVYWSRNLSGTQIRRSVL